MSQPRGGFRGGSRGAPHFGGRASGRGRGGGPPGPRLPSTLMAEVDETYGTAKHRRRPPTRKEIRKEARHGRKAGQSGPADRQRKSQKQEETSSEPDEEEEAEEDRRDVTKLEALARVSAHAESSTTGKKRVRDDTETQNANGKKKSKLPEISLPKSKAGDKEDDEIEWLEYMLRKDKGKGKQEEGSDDGLDDLLDFADLIGPGGKGLSRGINGNAIDEDDSTDDEDEQWGDRAGGGSSDQSEQSSDLDPSGGDESGESGHESEADDDEESVEEDRAGGGTDVQEGLDSGPEDGGSWYGITSPPRSDSSPVPPSAPTPGKYVPPHLRAALLEEKALGNKQKAEERQKLERKAQGLLNKLSEANIESILGDIEALYRDHSRHDVTTTLTNLVIQMISSRSNLLDSFVVLYATLIGALHRTVGIEFGAHFVHTLVMRYHALSVGSSATSTLPANIYETPDASKESLNLLVLIAELYNAQVISAKLIYDLIRGFTDSGSSEQGVLGEREVEGLLKVIKNCGPQLRSDDPASLKDIVTLVQDKVKGKEATMTTRARFMVDTLTSLKSGKSKSANPDQGGEAAVRMKRFLGGLGRKRRLLAYEPLRVSLSDLLSADTRGKWWLVGAGWSGNPLAEREEAVAAQPKKSIKVKEEEEVLLEVARKQGMNTDVRRGVFVTLMTSEDYVHACDRLAQLRLTDVQQRELVRVALHCCGLEKMYNPYYTLILNHLCSASYDHRFTLQYALWDFLRGLDEGESAQSDAKARRRKTVNIAKAIAYIIARGSMDLTVFKAIDFTALQSSTITFLTTCISHLIIATQTQSPLFALPKSFKRSAFDPEPVEELFERTLSNFELAQGWAWLMQTEMGKKGNVGAEEVGPVEGEIVKLGLGVARGVVAKAI